MTTSELTVQDQLDSMTDDAIKLLAEIGAVADRMSPHERYCALECFNGVVQGVAAIGHDDGIPLVQILSRVGLLLAIAQRTERRATTSEGGS